VAEVNTAAQRWSDDLATWAIPPRILESAPESPWIHPVEMFVVVGEIPDSPSHARARDALPAGGIVLDVGCGGGRAALALVPPATLVVGVDQQQPMLDRFASAAQARGVEHGEILGGWPASAEGAPKADVVVCHHVVYNVADLAPFLHALSAHASRRVVLELPDAHPLTHMAPSWKRFWDLDRPTSPTSADCLEVAREAGLPAVLQSWVDEGFSARARLPVTEQARFMRIRLCLPLDREPDIAAFLAASPPPPPRRTSTIWWDV
jgi:SAM-dependent methyltransferase